MWSFETPADGLGPRATTAERTLVLKWSPTRGVKEGNDVRLNLVSLAARILGTAK